MGELEREQDKAEKGRSKQRPYATVMLPAPFNGGGGWGDFLIKTLIHERVEMAQAGTNPTVLCRMPSGWAVLGDAQFIPGYCLLLPDPVVPDLNALDADARRHYLSDMTIIGDALLEETDAYRINYEILGNTDPALHTHIFPRYTAEPKEYVGRPVFSYPREERSSRPFDAERDRDLMQRLANAIRSRLK